MLKLLRLDAPKSCVSVGLRLSHLVRAFIFWLLDDTKTESLAFGNAFLNVLCFLSYNKCQHVFKNPRLKSEKETFFNKIVGK